MCFKNCMGDILSVPTLGVPSRGNMIVWLSICFINLLSLCSFVLLDSHLALLHADALGVYLLK